jgi:peptide/nickel transport system substrate-binding protein
MKRRDVLKAAVAAPTLLAAPSLVRAAGQSVLTFIPQSDLPSLDPVWTTADVTRNHAHLVFDSLYGLDDNYQPHPQMVQGHTVSGDGLQWDLMLRPGLKFHDNTPVLARDCVASIQRWSKRDVFGAVLAAHTDAVTAESDTVIRFRLKKPFPLLPSALAVTNNMCAMMPERLAKTDPFQQVTEMVGSGPFRFVANERVTGSRVVYEKFASYVPRPEGVAQGTSGPKTVHFDRIVWTVVPDPSTSSSALMAGEVDWWEQPQLDLVPQLKQDKSVTVTVKDHTGEIGCLRFNELYPPFNNPQIRRIVAEAVDQAMFMEAVAGATPELIKTGVGIFVPGTPMASDIGVDMMKGLKDPAAIKKELEAAGYKGERIVVLAASNYPTITAIATVGGDMLKRMGFNVDYQSMDWGSVVQRRASREPIDKGGWNIYFTFLGGTGNVIPASHIAIRASGLDAWFGWPNIPSLEALRRSWFDAPDLAAQKAICEKIQEEFWKGPTYVPLGMYFQPTAFKSNLKDIPEGIPQFYRVQRVGA